MNALLAQAKARFAELMANFHGWASIDELVDVCDEAGFWSCEFTAEAEQKAKKAVIRQIIKSIKGDDNAPEWASVVVTDEEGKTKRIYKQEMLFDVDDYQQVVDYHTDRARYHRDTAKAYARRCKEKLGVQLRFEFDSRDLTKKKPR